MFPSGSKTGTGRSQSRRARALALVFSIVLLAPGLNPAAGQQADALSPIRIRSPFAGQTVAPGGLFVVLELDPRVALEPESFELSLNGNAVDVEPKFSQASVRYLIRDRIPSGRHELVFSTRTVDGRALDPVVWSFRVAPGASGEVRPGSGLASLRGTTYVGTRNADFSGNSALRQEPSSTYMMRSDLTAKYGVFSFPIKAYLTTDETTTAQPRNRVLVGVESPWFSVYGGDTQPDYSPLTLSGARARGVLAEVHVPGVRLSVVRGQLRRAVDLLSAVDDQVASPFLNTYRRMMSAAHVAFGSPRTVEFSLHAMKARDDTTSIAFGVRPMENVVAGSDFRLSLFRERFSFESGAAVSLTTEDISRGVSDKAEIDSLFDVNLPIDPADLGWLITLNPSTVPLRIDKLSSLSWYASAASRLAGHRFSVEYRSVGSAFYSAGNPFLVSDRRTFTISDRFRELNDRLTGAARYTRYASQPDPYRLSVPLESSLYSLALSYRPVSQLPTVSTGLRYTTRVRGDEISMLSDSRMLSMSLGVLQQFGAGRPTHTVQVLASRARRTDRVNEQLNSTTSTVSAGLVEQLTARLNASLQVTLVAIAYDAADDRQRWTTASLGASYRFAGFPLRLTGQTRISRASASTLLTGSDRYGGDITAAYDLQSNMTVELELGTDTFRDQTIEAARYTERFISLRHRYTF